MNLENIGKEIMMPPVMECLKLFLNSPYFLNAIRNSILIGYENPEKAYTNCESDYYFIYSEKDLKTFLKLTSRYRPLPRKPISKQLFTVNEEQKVVNLYTHVLYPELLTYILSLMYLVNEEKIREIGQTPKRNINEFLKVFSEYNEEVSLAFQNKFNEEAFIKNIFILSNGA